MSTPHDKIDRLIGDIAARNTTPQLSDVTLAAIVADVATAINGRVEDENVAMLVDVAAALLRRFTSTLPPAAYRDDNGEPCYTSEQLAAFHGISVAEVEALANRISADDPEGHYVRRIEISNLNPVQ